MEQLPIKKQITGTRFYLDEIEFLIFLIWLEKHNKVMMSDTAPVAVREFYTKCYRDGKIKDFRTAEVLANKEDCALIGNCIAHILNEELPTQLHAQKRTRAFIERTSAFKMLLCMTLLPPQTAHIAICKSNERRKR